jgi:hypothetical protein
MTNIYAKIAKVSKAVGSLEADKRNQQARYDYISADKILSVAGKAMADSGLVVIPTVISQTVYEMTSGSGKKFYDAEIAFVMIVSDGGDTTIEALWIGRGSDYTVPDKAVYKAITSGHKYFLMKLFNIGVGNEDGEHESVQVGNCAETSPQAQAERKPDWDKVSPPMTDKKRKEFHAIGNEAYGPDWDEKRHQLCAAVGVESSNDLTMAQAQKLIDGMRAKLEG